MKTTLCGIDENGKDQFYHAHAQFYRMMDQVFFGLPFARRYINDMIIFCKTPQEHVRHLQIVLNGFDNEDCICTMANTSVSMTD
jgi:hypothetical protein